MKARIAGLEQKLSITQLKAEASTQARNKAEAQLEEAVQDRRTAISAAQKLKGHLDLALRDVGKLREERDAVKAQAELQAAQARQGRAMADETVNQLKRELGEAYEQVERGEKRLAELEERVRGFVRAAHEAEGGVIDLRRTT